MEFDWFKEVLEQIRDEEKKSIRLWGTCLCIECILMGYNIYALAFGILIKHPVGIIGAIVALAIIGTIAWIAVRNLRRSIEYGFNRARVCFEQVAMLVKSRQEDYDLVGEAEHIPHID